MHYKRGLGLLLLFALLPAMLTVWFTVPVKAATLLVPSQYPSIQAAVDAARSGDTIQVAAGTYLENVAVTQSVTIIGESASATIVDGRGQNIVFNIEADNVELRQLTIRNGGRRYSGVSVYYLNSGAKIRNNRIRDNAVGVIMSTSGGHVVENNVLMNNSLYGIDSLDLSSGNTFKNNTISDSAYGIELSDTSNSQVVLNTISHTSYGVYAAYSNNNNASANTFSDSSWSIYFAYSNSNVVGFNKVLNGSLGIEVVNSLGNSVINNTLSGSSYGIYLGYCGANTVSGNVVSGYDWGIELYGSTGSTIKENRIEDNTWGFYLAQGAKWNYIYHNNVVNNVKQCFQDPTASPNTWSTPTTPYQGNHWSDYKGIDTNGDGIGDTYLPWAAVDYYPLMFPYGVHDVTITSVTVPFTVAYKGDKVNITVIAGNEGGVIETFTVTAYANTTVVGTQTVTSLAPANTKTLFFIWDTSNAVKGNYTIKAEANVVPGETNTGNNSFTDGTVKLQLQGDINGDGNVDAIDFAIFGQAWGTQLGDPNYNPSADFNHDGFIDALDLAILAKYYGQ